MSIKAKLIILTIFSLTVTTVMGLIMLQDIISVGKEIKKLEIIAEIRSNLFERVALQDEYLLLREERPILQLKITSVALEQLFIQASNVFTLADEQISISGLSNNNKFIDQILSQIVANFKSQDSNSSASTKELEQRLIKQILIKAQESAAITSQLSEASRNRIIDNQQRATFFVIIFIFGIILVIISVLYFVWLSIVKPLVALKEATMRIASLDFSSSTFSYSTSITSSAKLSNNEIGKLAQAFNTMVGKLKEAYSGLERKVEERTMAISEEKAQDEAILSSIGDAIMACNKDGVIVLFNGVAEVLTGYSAAKIIGYHYNQALKFVRENDGEKIDDFIAETITTGQASRMTDHTLLITKDGRKIPVADSAAPIKNVRGEIIGCVVVFRDVTYEQEIDKAKTEFVSLASHQLRTPLSTVSWYTEMLLAGDAGKLNAEQKNYLDKIYTGSQRMAGLVNRLLEVSSIELGTFVFEPEPTDIVKLAQSVIDEQKLEIDAKRITFSSIFEKNLPLIQADPKLLRKVVQNILSNAVKYTPEGGKITFELALSDAQGKVLNVKGQMSNILLKVSDTGYGIPKKQQDNIFTKLFRADNVRVKDTEGTGLGLYLVKLIIKHSGGEVRFESEENKGTTFYVTLPLAGVKKKEDTEAVEQ